MIESQSADKGLKDLLTEAANIEKARKKAVSSGAAGPMAGIVKKMDACLVRVSASQNKNSEDPHLFAATSKLRKQLEVTKKGLTDLVKSMKEVASLEKEGAEGAAEAAEVVEKLMKSARAAEVKTMLKRRHGELLKKQGK
jgi:hypothetical protein